MLLLLPFVAHAAPPADASEETVEVVEEGKRIRFRAREEMEFEGVHLEGELRGPDGILIPIPPRPVFNPLIHLREDWKVEQRWSIDEIQ